MLERRPGAAAECASASVAATPGGVVLDRWRYIPSAWFTAKIMLLALAISLGYWQ